MIRSLSVLLLIATASFFTASSVDAQQVIQLQMGDVKVDSPSYDTQKTPNFQAGDVKTKNIPNPRDWLEIEIPFEVKGPRKAVIKELLFRYYVGLVDKDGTPKTLTGDVKHVNVPTGEKTFSSAYISPSTLGDLTGDFRRFQSSNVKGIGVEVVYNGVIVGGVSTTNSKFWEATGVTPGVLGKAETPFALLWIDRYADVERPAK